MNVHLHWQWHRIPTVENPHASVKSGGRLWLRAFNRIDLLAVLAALGFSTLVALPLFGDLRPRSELAICQNNLRQIGQAFQIWSHDHDGWRPVRVPVDQGGTWPPTFDKIGNAWYEFAWISNELVTPKLLVCPSDTETRRMARDFSAQPDGGFLHATYRANALSYFLGLDVYPRLPLAALAGDRNFRPDGLDGGCGSRVKNKVRVNDSIRLSSNIEWTNAVHGLTGNLLLDDGTVQTVASLQLRAILGNGADNGYTHFLMPR